MLPELRELLFLARHLKGLAHVETLAQLEQDEMSFPLLAFRFGPADSTLPVLALFGGVHGLERIGTRVVISYLQTIMELAKWDRSTQAMLETTRLLIVPLVNPVGMYLQRRSNGNSVDLMRNAPVHAEGLAKWQLFAGHRVYRLEPQSRAYLAHGDLWDYLYDEHRTAYPDGRFIPFTLELGSWLWVKKNWSQVFSLLGMFNPRLPHRGGRILRRHTLLFDFLYRAVQSPEPWARLDDATRERSLRQGLGL